MINTTNANLEKEVYERGLSHYAGRDITTITDAEADSICNILFYLANEFYDCTYEEAEDIYTDFIRFREEARKDPVAYDYDCMEYFITVCLENDLNCAENYRDDGKNYLIIHNDKFDSEEVLFYEKPSEAVRDALKSLHFRWNKKTGRWYGFSDPKTISAAIDAAEAPLVIPETEETEVGTMYEGWRGGNNSKWRSYEELKKLLQADFKKAGIMATIKRNRAGYLTSICVTISISSSDFITPAEFINNSGFWLNGCGSWLYYTDSDDSIQSVHKDYVFDLPEYKADPDAFVQNVKVTDYNLMRKHIETGHTVTKYDIEVLTPAARAKYNLAAQIVESYNRDNSDLYTDYFDRDIYEDFAFKVS